LGIVPLPQALEIAKKQSLDLIEVAPMAVPPVCRLLDFGKYKYEQAKKERELRKSQRVALLREIRLRPKIDGHDFEAKARSVKKLLQEGDKVKVTVMFRGREITHPELGVGLLKKMSDAVQGMATLEKQPVMEGKRLHMVLTPGASHKVKVNTEEEKKELQNAEVKNA
jgi:translation initiation factor IF-3